MLQLIVVGLFFVDKQSAIVGDIAIQEESKNTIAVVELFTV